MLINYYYILGIPHTATSEEIKRAFRKKAKILHPDVDKSIDAKKRFQTINEAYQTLIDFEKRRKYDYKWKTRYGLSFINRKHQTQNTNNYYRAYTNPAYYKKHHDAPLESTALDLILFFSLIIVGGASIVMGTLHLIYEKWEGVDDLSGLLMGLWITFLLLYSLRFISKSNKK